MTLPKPLIHALLDSFTSWVIHDNDAQIALDSPEFVSGGHDNAHAAIVDPWDLAIAAMEAVVERCVTANGGYCQVCEGILEHGEDCPVALCENTLKEMKEES